VLCGAVSLRAILVESVFVCWSKMYIVVVVTLGESFVCMFDSVPLCVCVLGSKI
jgi:hypothetical protein